MNLSTLLRRRTMMIQASVIPYDTLGYGVLYPKSVWRPHPHINIIYEMKNHPEYVCGISFSDETEVVQWSPRNIQDSHIIYKYILNGIVHTEEKTTAFTFPESATERISLHFGVNFYNPNAYTITESQCVVWNVTNTRTYYTAWLKSQQVLIAPECISYSFGQNISTSNGFGGEIDTCWLDFNNYNTSAQTFRTRWANNLELETVYLRKNVKNIGTSGYFSFTDDSNLKDLYVEWTLDEDIIKWSRWMTFPADMTLHIPKGTRELYEAKGWGGRYNIDEYTQITSKTK